ncbi:MAG: hypothetical protein VR70_05005 [Rhodospirillaceae bacterium BRH_c57]|nr:MAG: hypothetical protein VR70_05005 [Rhodospirillaceae bacterium BRH_c57]
MCAVLSAGGPVTALRHHDRVVEAGEDLVRPGDPVDESFTCLSGWLFTYYLLEDGRRQILGFTLPGEVISLIGETGPAPFGLQAMTQVRVCAASNAALGRWLRGRCEESQRLMLNVSQHATLAYGLVTSLGRRTARERVAYLLLELHMRLGTASDGNVRSMPLTQSIIADALGLTAVHVNRTLAQLREVGVVSYVNRRLHIVDGQRLWQEAGAERDPLLTRLRNDTAASAAKQKLI